MLDSPYDNTLSRKLALTTADLLYNDSLYKDKTDPASQLLHTIHSRPDRKLDYNKNSHKKVTKNIKKELNETEITQLKITHGSLSLPFQINELFNSFAIDDIMMEGELMKYKPGFKYHYISRYCHLTKS